MRLPPADDRRPALRDAILVGLVAAALYLPAMGARDLWNPNEPIYGEAVREMAARGDRLVPWVNGKVFPEKPILYYWGALAAATVGGGVREATLRVPSAVAGIAGALLTYLLVLPYAGRRRAVLAAAILASSFGFLWGARSIQMDILVTVTTLAVVVPVLWVVDHGASPLKGWALAGAAAGLGFLAKGPVGWIAPGLALGAYLLVTRRLKALLRVEVAIGAIVCLVVAAPWYLMLWARGETSFLVEVLWRQNFTRFVNPWDHQAPFWYYLPYLAIDFAPWSWFLPLVPFVTPADEDDRRLRRVSWLTIAAIVIFFSLSKSKRSPYILPIAPAVAALAAGVVEGWIAGALSARVRAAARAIASIAGGILLLGGAAALVRGVPGKPEIAGAVSGLGVVLAAGGGAVLATGVRRRWVRFQPAALFAAVVALYLHASIVVLPAVDAFKSARRFCDEAVVLAGPEGRFRSYRFWDWRAGYAYYLGRPIENLADREALREAWTGREPFFLIVENHVLDDARAVIGDLPPLVRRPVGGSEAYLFSNAAAGVSAPSAPEGSPSTGR